VVRFVLEEAELCGGGVSVVALISEVEVEVEDTDWGSCVAEIEAASRYVAGGCQVRSGLRTITSLFPHQPHFFFCFSLREFRSL
jgi:hypothetical protein